ncbi:MAG TPA: hypothetical protein PLT65_00350 [Bacilli bacterium]|nr:hypothetical protein [Bacilli bacterium]
MDEKKGKKKINNYLILIVLCLATFGITMYCLGLYKISNEYKMTIPVLEDVVAEVNYEGLDEFLTERNVTILYMCVVNENKCRNFEKRFKNYIIENNLRDEIFYFNLGNHNSTETFLKKFYEKYKSDILIKKIVDYPVIVIFNNTEIIDVLTSEENYNISIEDVGNFLKDYLEIL